MFASRMGVGATSFRAGFMLRSMRGGGDMGGEAAGIITGRTGVGRGAATTTGGAEGDAVEGVAVADVVGDEEGTPDIAEAQEVRCEMRRDDRDGSSVGDAIRKDCTCCAAATKPCWNLRASCLGSWPLGGSVRQRLWFRRRT